MKTERKKKKKVEAKAASKRKRVPGAASTKTAALIRLLKRKKGIPMAHLLKTSGWNRHSVQGFLTKLRIKDGLKVKAVADKRRGWVYGIAA